MIIMTETTGTGANVAQGAANAGQAQPNDANAQGATNPSDVNANANASQNPEEKEEKLSFLLEIPMADVKKRLEKRGAQIVGAQIRSLRLVELTRTTDKSIYYKFVVNLRQSVRAMINKGTALQPQWEAGYTTQVWLFPNQVLRACVEGGLDETLLPHLQSNLQIDVMVNSFLAGSMMMLAIEPVTEGTMYYSPFTGEERGEVKNTSFYFLPYSIILPTRGMQKLEQYADKYMMTFAEESVKLDMEKKK